jgi:lipoate-protein ligase A
MLQVLRIGKEKMSDKGTTSAKKRVDPLRRQTGLTSGRLRCRDRTCPYLVHLGRTPPID